MPKEYRKRGRREEKKRKRVEEEEEKEEKEEKEEEEEDSALASKRRKSQDAAEQGFNTTVDDIEPGGQHDYTTYAGPGDLPFYGLLDDDEQEYFKRADSMLEHNQFANPEERTLFLANIYKEANGKELRIANSQSCSRLMERLILLSTPIQLKVLFQKLSGHFLHLVQHRFASHCCEALFIHAAPVVSQELTAPIGDYGFNHDNGEVYVSMEDIFLDTLKELQTNLGYLMTDQFASHPLRVLLLVLSGSGFTAPRSSTLLQSKKKERISITGQDSAHIGGETESRAIPASFKDAVDQVIAETVAGLDTTYLRALTTHPIANPVLQQLLELELTRSGKQSIKDTKSLFRKLLPDDPLEDRTESVSFINSLLYDPIGSRFLEIIVTLCPGKIFKALYKYCFMGKLGILAKNEVAAFVVIKIIERLGKDDLQNAMDHVCPHIDVLIKRSRTSVIKALIERCRVRHLNTLPISAALKQAYGEEPSDCLTQMLKVSYTSTMGMAEDRRKQLEIQDSTKTHGSLLAQCMLESPGLLRELITDGLLALKPAFLITIAKDRTASRVIQSALVCPEQTPKFCRMLIPRFYGRIKDLAIDTVASHVIDSLWAGSTGLPFIRERIVVEIAQHEASLRTSVPGRAVWRNWRMDIYKTRRKEWLNKGKVQDGGGKTGIELARERYAVGISRVHSVSKPRMGSGTGANGAPIQGKA